jgi:hypothetical protein
MTSAPLLLIILALSACASTEEVCAERGVPKGSPNYWICANMVEQEGMQRAAILNGVSANLNATSQSFLNAAPRNDNLNVWVH